MQTSATHLALLRGVNVGGKNLLPMKLLAQLFVDSGCIDVRTYIQSGNVVFSAPRNGASGLPEELATRIAKRINDQFKFRVPVVMRSVEEVAATVRNNPYLSRVADQKALHAMFLADHPDPTAIAALDPSRSLPDEFTVRGREIYLHLPNGVANSKLTNAYFDSKLATTSTCRNWSTVMKLAEWMGIDVQRTV